MTRPPSECRIKAPWESTAPRTYSIVTGFFPETAPRDTWATNPRPLLVLGTARYPDTGLIFCRVAYGTTQHLQRAHADDLVIGNMSLLDQLRLKRPTRFVLNPGRQMVIMPWTAEYFRPWSDSTTPIRSILPEDMQRHVGATIARLPDLPRF